MSKQTRTRTSADADVLAQLTGFIGRYLQCSEHQRTVLALWILHTYTFSAAQVTPYLSIQSAYKQSGKTLCLQLLSLLCDNPALTSGFTASNISLRMKHRPVSSILLDECQSTLGTRSRDKALALRAFLAGAFHRGFGYSGAVQDYSVFCPKAFAGKGQLPQELADRSVPVILGPLGTPAFLGYGHDLEEVLGSKPPASRSYVEQPPSAGWGMPHHPQEIIKNHVACNTTAQEYKENSETCSLSPVTCNLPVLRFNLSQATKEAQPLKELLSAWAKDHLPRLKELPACSHQDFPPNLSPRRQDLCEPLLQLADTVGGPWPARARQALTAVFAQEAAFDLQPALQLLADVRHCFQFHSFPERLSTSTLMDWMRTLPARPWDADGPLTPRTFARLLLAFDVRPRLQRIAEDGPARGYQLHDFMEPWRRHLGCAPIHKFPPALPPGFRSSNESKVSPQSAGPGLVSPDLPRPAGDDPMANVAAGDGKLEAIQSEIVNGTCPQSALASRRDAGCNTIAAFSVNEAAALQNRAEEPKELR